jgi:hypothetical protein
MVDRGLMTDRMAGGSWIVGRSWIAGRSLIIAGSKLESR